MTKKKAAKVERTTRALGVTSGLNKQAWCRQTFAENQKAKKADDELQAVYDAEFPQATHGTRYLIAALRSSYNRGLFTKGQKPKVQSRCFQPATRKEA